MMRRKLQNDVAQAIAVDGAYIGSGRSQSQQLLRCKSEKIAFFRDTFKNMAATLWIEPLFGLKGAMIAGPKVIH